MVLNIVRSYGHVLSGIISFIITVLLAATQADGRSFVKSDDFGGTGTRGGLGIWKDQLGQAWVNPNNPVQACDEWVDMAQSIPALVLPSTVFSAVLVVIHLLALKTQGKKPGFTTAAIVLNAANLVLFVTTLGVAVAIYDGTYCGLRAADLFDMNYAIPLVVVAIVATIVSILILLVVRAGAPVEGESNEPIPDVDKEAKAESA